MGRRRITPLPMKLAYEFRKRVEMPPFVPGRGSTVMVPYPPLTTTLMLGDERLQDHLDIDIETAEAGGIFTEFVWNFMRPEALNPMPMSTWFKAESQFDKRALWQLFIRGSEPIEVAARMIDLFRRGGLPGKFTESELTVETSDGVIGFADGRVLTTFAKMQLTYPHFSVIEEALQRWGAGRASTAAFARVWLQVHRHPNKAEREALILTLSIMHWRTDRVGDILRMLYDVERSEVGS